MQNKYIGDPGDFAKFLLLKSIIRKGESLGVNWYLVPDETNNDGNIILKNELRLIDEILFDKLSILRQTKSITEVENAGLIGSEAEIKYHSEILSIASRTEWFKNSFAKLIGNRFIFCDPDNGIEVASYKASHPKTIKYITLEEIKSYYDSNATVIVYQHGNRNGDLIKQQLSKKLQISERLQIPTDSIKAIYCGNGTPRFFFIVMQPYDIAPMSDRINSLPSIFKLIN